MKMQSSLIPVVSSRLSRWHKRIVIWGSVLLALTGLLWMVGEYAIYFWPEHDGPDTRSILHKLVMTHGIIAYLAAFVLGSLLGRHVPAGLRRSPISKTGLIGLILCGLMVLSALGLYYAPSPDTHDMASVIHQIVGVIGILVVGFHIGLHSK